MKIYVKSDELWDYFQKNSCVLNNQFNEIAEISDDETNDPLVRIYVTSDQGFPALTVEQVLEGDEERILERECAISKADCIKVYEELLKKAKIYGESLLGKGSTKEPDEADDTDIEIVNEREAELHEALATFLNIFMGLGDIDEVCFPDEELTEILNDIETMMFETFGYVGYRPRIVEQDGKYKLVDYLYDEEDFYG